MGAYAYCRKCDAGLDNPTFAECVNMKIECHNCGHDYELGHDESKEALISLEERITALEARFNPDAKKAVIDKLVKELASSITSSDGYGGISAIGQDKLITNLKSLFE